LRSKAVGWNVGERKPHKGAMRRLWFFEPQAAYWRRSCYWVLNDELAFASLSNQHQFLLHYFKKTIVGAYCAEWLHIAAT
jgi:hypothetical protein